MQSFAWYVHRLRSMSAAEIAWRVRSAAAAQIDLVRIPLGFVPRIDVSGELSRDRFEPGFACMPDNTTAREDRQPDWDRRLLASADSILEDRLTFFNLDDQHLGSPIDWQRDGWSDKATRLRLSHLTDYRDFDDAGDCKLVWEPNRHHQLVVLARAWKISGEKRYARKVVEVMIDWIQQNPFGYGMNWKSGLELGVRLINWVWAIDLIRDADVFSEEEWRQVMQNAYLAMWDTQRRYSRGSSANNHLVGEVAGVLVASCYFDCMPNAAKWREDARKILEHELFAQSFADGCTREHAFGYQFFVLQFYSLSLIAMQRSGHSMSAEFSDRLHTMFRFMGDICADTGRQPEFGDADDGYVLDLGDRPRDGAAPLLAVGEALFADDELAASSETNWWLFGRGVSASDATDMRTSSAYPESGYFVLRSENSEHDVRVFFDCAELGFGSIAAHGHADCLSFVLAVDGRELLVDPGTYDYFTYPAWRNHLRTTAAHNTVEVDGESQSELLGPFIWGERANAKVCDWQDDAQSVSVCGEHDGYLRLASPLLHRRRLTLDKRNGSVEIVDMLRGSGKHDLRIGFHLAPDCEVSEADSGIRIERDGLEMQLGSTDGKFEIIRADDVSMTGWVSTHYHHRQKSTSVFLRCRSDGDTDVRMRLSISTQPQDR